MLTTSVSDVRAYQNEVIPSSVSKDIMGRDDFLRILITQLKNQDPLEPMDQKDTIAQLTQFNVLDELRGIGSAIEGGQSSMSQNMAVLANLQKSMIDAQSVSLVGKEIRTPRDYATVDEDREPTFYFVAPEGTANVQVNVYDVDGSLVKTEDLGQMEGENYYQLLHDGLPAGAYRVEAVAQSASQGVQSLLLQLSGRVSGIHFGVEGVLLEVDGQGVSLEEVAYVQGA
jgi:flagellar basal-body rod modification protein FlgD